MVDLNAHLPIEQGVACYAALHKAYNDAQVNPQPLTRGRGQIRSRDRARCTEPYCDAPARQTDHIVRAADGGPTNFDDGRAVCEMHNYLREQPGWWVEPTPEGTRTTTPTGHSYLSRAG